jgi:hypothetical protein
MSQVDVGGQGLDESVRDQDPEKGADECGGHLMADHLGGAVDGPHGDHDPEHRGHDPHARHGVADLLEDHSRFDPVLVVGVDVRIHEGFDLVRGDPSDQDQPDRVGHEIELVVIGHELGVLGKDAALLRAFDVGFQGDGPFFLAHQEELVHHLQDVEVHLGGDDGAFQDPEQAGDDLGEEFGRG